MFPADAIGDCIREVTVLDESYNASPEAVMAALELLAVQPGRRFAVLGTMRELGDRSVELHAAEPLGPLS